MKVAFVFPPMWPPHSDGSLQIWNREVTTRLSKFCDVLVYTGMFDHQRQEDVDGVRYRRFSTDLDRWLINRVHSVHKRIFRNRVLARKGPLVYSDLWCPGYAIKVALDLRKQNCDIVHVYYFPQFANLIKRLNPGLRVILHMHGEWLTQIKFNNLAARLNNLDLVISCSKFITQSIAAKFPQVANRCRTLPMGLSTDAFPRDDLQIDPDKPSPKRLLCVGRISPEKGVHVLLEAFELVLRRFPDASLTIVGPESIAAKDEGVDLCLDKDVAASLAPFYEGSYLAQIKQKLSPEAARRVEFAGLVPYGDVPGYYANADIYISPSLYESFGMSVIEAMAAGLPVVAARVRSFEDLISDGRDGLIVAASDPQAIADAVGKLFANAELRDSISCAAREAVRTQFSWETICSTLIQMYREGTKTDVPSINQQECVKQQP